MVKIIHFHMIILTKLIAVSNAARPLIAFVMSIYIYIYTVVLRHLGMKGRGQGVLHSNKQDFVFDDLLAPLATNKPLIIFFPPPRRPNERTFAAEVSASFKSCDLLQILNSLFLYAVLCQFNSTRLVSVNDFKLPRHFLVVHSFICYSK